LRKLIPEQAAEYDKIVNFGAYTRDAWVAEKAASVPAGSRVLDAGAGQCPYRKLFQHCEYRTQDLARYSGTSTGVSVENWVYGRIDYVSDIVAIPVDDRSFDVVLCTEVLEHVPNPVGALSEFGRILRPGGRLLLSAPLGSGLHQEPFHFYGGFTPHFYRKFLKEAGMQSLEIRAIGGLLKHTGQEMHRVGRLLALEPKTLRNLILSVLLQYWLPREFARREERGALFEEFTVGYLIDAIKGE